MPVAPTSSGLERPNIHGVRTSITYSSVFLNIIHSTKENSDNLNYLLAITVFVVPSGPETIFYFVLLTLHYLNRPYSHKDFLKNRRVK